MSQMTPKPERRTAKRFFVAGSNESMLIVGDSQINVRPVDISSTGLGVWSRQSLDCGSTVLLDLGQNSREPEKSNTIGLKVRWCKKNFQNTEFFRCGLEVADESQDLIQFYRGIELENDQIDYFDTIVMALLGTVSRDIAHDINNSVHILQLTAASLIGNKEKIPPEDREKFEGLFDVMKVNAEWIGRVVQTLRTFSSPQTISKFDKINIAQIFDDIEMLIGNRFRHTSIKFTIDRTHGDLSVRAQESGLVRAVLNLVSNSFEAMCDTNGKFVHIDTQLKDDYVEIGVSDSGAPLTEASWEQMVTPFYSSKVIRGHGLGLDIAKRVVLEHQGKLTFDPDADCCRIVIRLPKWRDSQ